ncbi:hypothetical protein COP1_040082 [Malus domestica]
MWAMAARGMAEAEEEAVAVVVVESGSHKRRWVVRMRRPNLRCGKLGRSSHSRSTAERREHSISVGRRTGRPLVVSSAACRQFPAI